MESTRQLDDAIGLPDPVAGLRSLAGAWLAEGKGCDEVLALLEEYRGQLRRQGREDQEDAVLDVMDFVSGWCSPHMKLSPGRGE